MNEKWLHWAMELQSIAQAGLTFYTDRYDLDRYEKIWNIVIEILHEYTDIDHKKIRELFAAETGYQTPKVDIRASVFKDNKILMIKENTETLDAGFFESDKLPELSCERNTPDQIKMCFKARKFKVFETIFD